MTNPELGDPFLDTPVDIFKALPAFAAEYSALPDMSTAATNIICRHGQATIVSSPESVAAMTTRRELLLVTDFWLDNPQEKPRGLGKKGMEFIRAFCGYEPAVANLERLQHNKEQEAADLTKAPLDLVLLDSVVIDNEPYSFVTGKSLQRFVRKEMPSEKHVRVSRIVEHIGQMLTPNYNDVIEDLVSCAPLITAPGIAYLGSGKWDRADNWGISPDIFPLGYDLLGDPNKSSHWGHTPRCDKVIRSYLQTLQGTSHGI